MPYSMPYSIQTPQELLDWMEKNIQYGYLTQSNTIEKEINGIDFFKNYKLQSPGELVYNKFGVCWDQSEFQRFMFNKMNIKNEVIYMIQKILPNLPTHSYSIIEMEDGLYWFEHSWKAFKGIHGPYKTIHTIASLVHDKTFEVDHKYDSGWDYGIISRPNYGISCKEYMEFAGKAINSNIS